MPDIKIHCSYDALVPISEIKLNTKNRNKHPEEQILRLMEIIKYNGVRRCVTVSKRSGIVTVGHGRIEAMKRLGMKEIPVNFQDYESEEAEYADGVADNAIGLWAELDLAGINSDLGDLGPDFDLNMLGIKDFVLDIAEKLEPGCDEDEVPEAGPAYVVKGDVFTLGRHRLKCGDSTMIDDVEKLMAGERVPVVFTDPPYNLQEHGQKKRTNKTESKTEDFGDWDVGFDPLDVLPVIAAVTSEDSHRFVCTSSWLFGQIHDWFEKAGEKPNYLVWSKNNPMPSLSKASFVQASELIVHSRRGSPVFNYPKGQNLPNVFNGNVEAHEFGHPSQKPVYVIEYCLAPTEGAVLDLFGGSGSTLIACEKTNRQCFMMELDEKYCTVILDRWAKYAGKDPIRESDGKLWSKIKAEAMNGAA